MGSTSIWGRVIWKEFRESILIGLLCLVFPIVGFSMKTSTSVVLAGMATPAAIFIWAAAKANVRSSRREFETTHLPLPAAPEWVASFVFPAIVAAAVGACYGYWGSALGNSGHAGALTLVAMRYFLAGFGTIYVISTVFTVWPATVVSLGWLFFAAYMTDSLFKNPHASPSNLHAIIFLHRAAIAGALGSVVFSIPLLKGSLRVRQVTALLLVAGITFGPYVKLIWSPEPASDLYSRIPAEKSSQDRSLTVKPAELTWGSEPLLSYTDYRSSFSREREFPWETRPIGFGRRGTVYLAQQRPHEKEVTILAWDTSTDHVEDVVRLRAGRKALRGFWEWSGTVSPDGHYVLIGTNSQLGEGTDLWMVDTARKTSAVLLANAPSGYDEVEWFGDKAIVGGGKALEVDLKEMKASVADFALAKEK